MCVCARGGGWERTGSWGRKEEGKQWTVIGCLAFLIWNSSLEQQKLTMRKAATGYATWKVYLTPLGLCFFILKTEKNNSIHSQNCDIKKSWYTQYSGWHTVKKKKSINVDVYDYLMDDTGTNQKPTVVVAGCNAASFARLENNCIPSHKKNLPSRRKQTNSVFLEIANALNILKLWFKMQN